MKRFLSCLAFLLSAALLFGSVAGCSPEDPVSGGPTSDPGGVTVQEPMQIPAIDRTALTQTTADGIMALMKETEATRVALDEQSRQALALQQQQWQQALLPLLQDPVDITQRGARAGEDVTALLQQLLTQVQGGAVYLPAGRYILRADVTVPAQTALIFEHGALLHLENCTLTINGYVQAPYTARLFEGGAVVCTRDDQVGYPQWFGAVADGRHDDTAAVQACVDAFAVTVLPGAGDAQYRLSTVQVGDGRTLRGEGGHKTGVTAAPGTTVLFSLNGSHIDVSDLHLTLTDAAAGSSAFLLNNAATELTDLHLHRINADRGAHFVSDTGNGKDITHVRLFEIDCRDATDISYYLRNVAAFLYLEHCIVDYAQATIIRHETIDFASFYVENCVGLLLENCDPLGGYQLGGSGGHGYVLRNCAAVYLNRGYADTLNGYGYWFDTVSYSTVINSGGGLNGHVGLLMENCHDVSFELFQIYGRRPLMDNQMDGIVLRGCRDVSFTNLQSFWHLGHALILEDSQGIVIHGYTCYENAGAGLIERGTSDHNLIDGYVRSDCPQDDEWCGAHSGVFSLVSNTKTQNAMTDSTVQPSSGTYTPAGPAAESVSPVSPAAVAAAFDAGAAQYLTLHEYYRTLCTFAADTVPDAADAALGDLYAAFGSVNVRQLGAVGDGVTDDTSAFEQAIQQGGTVAVPAGTYRIARNLSIDSHVHLCLAAGAVLCPDPQVVLSVYGLLQTGSRTVFAGGTVRGTLRNLYGYPQWFGAAGDGAADDTAAFAAAFSMLTQVYVPYTPAYYLLDGLTLPGRSTLRGVGPKAPVLHASDALAKFITFREKNVVLTDLALDMSATTGGSIALFFDNAQENIAMFFVRNVTVTSPCKTVADRRTDNRTLIHNVYFDNMRIVAPRDVTFYYGDFYGFIFMRHVTVDYQGAVTHVPAVQVKTNYGLIMEDCLVCNAGAGSTGDAYVFSDCWDVWSLDCRAENIGGNGFTFTDMHHCFFMDLTAVGCGGNGFVFGSQFDQYHGITADRTAGILFDNACYLTVSDVAVTNSTGHGLALQRSGFCNLYGLTASASQENDLFERADSFYCVLTDFSAPKTVCDGHKSLYRNL
ncbi:MAG: hypothetical protein IKI50_01415 [Clostridia bacterium]|nr:hypothetical protein [Clostridia bacterium]